MEHGQRGMTPKERELYDLGNSRETWCLVEKTSKQDWCRTNRKHYDRHLSSSMFKSGETSHTTSTGRKTMNSSASLHRERRHYGYHSKYMYVVCVKGAALRIFVTHFYESWIII